MRSKKFLQTYMIFLKAHRDKKKTFETQLPISAILTGRQEIQLSE
jgi:hypothetical protein